MNTVETASQPPKAPETVEVELIGPVNYQGKELTAGAKITVRKTDLDALRKAKAIK